MRENRASHLGRMKNLSYYIQGWEWGKEKTAEKVRELAREAKPTKGEEGVGGGLAPLPR